MDGQNGHPLDFKHSTGKVEKKDYVFDFGKARVCTHPVLKELVQGSHKYRCERCNYDFWLPTATMWPAHWGPIMAAFEIMKFVKDFGVDALEHVYRTPIGQYDGTEHKPVLPEGKSFKDVLRELDDVDVNRVLGTSPRAALAKTSEETNGLSPVPQERDRPDSDGSPGGLG